MDSLEQVPIIDVSVFLSKDKSKQMEECKKVADSLNKYGILIWKDPRVNEQDNEDYIDMMEQYFNQTSKKYYSGEKLEDCVPQFNFQAGVTPEKQERARNHYKIAAKLKEEDKPFSKFPPELDAKWRFFWPIGERPNTIFNNIPMIVPKGFPDWYDKMNKWGYMMLNCCFTAAEMAAIGMGLQPDAFTSMMQGGPHLLAPTGSDLIEYDVGTTFAGFHYDLNFLTVHGKSRFPGLFIWLRNWQKVAVKLPSGCLLLQAGAMFEHLTGGYVLAGYHEVIYTDQTKQELEKAKEQKGRILWRVSSTLFSHLRYNVDLSPLPELKNYYDLEEAKQKYQPMTAHEKLMEELTAINLTPSKNKEDKIQ